MRLLQPQSELSHLYSCCPNPVVLVTQKEAMKFVKLTMIAALFVIGASFMSPALVRAQEGEPVVVDEVIAQVNDGIITLSQLKREMKERVQTLVQNGMTEPQATADVEKKKNELIAILINEQLLL